MIFRETLAMDPFFFYLGLLHRHSDISRVITAESSPRVITTESSPRVITAERSPRVITQRAHPG